MLCSGTLVAPRAVLAAAHCLDAFGPDGAYEIVFGQNVDGPGVLARRALAHPAYDPATHEHDLAVFELARDATAAPATLPAEGFVIDTGAPARVVGFGVTRSADEPTGVKRSGLTRVTTLTDGAFEASADPSMSCSGDSGGPVFVTGASGETLAGVTASGDAIGMPSAAGGGGSPPGASGSTAAQPDADSEAGGCALVPRPSLRGPIAWALAALLLVRRRPLSKRPSLRLMPGEPWHTAHAYRLFLA